MVIDIKNSIGHFQEDRVRNSFWQIFDKYVSEKPRIAVYHFYEDVVSLREGYFIVGKLEQDKDVEATLMHAGLYPHRMSLGFPRLFLILGLKKSGKNIEFQPVENRLNLDLNFDYQVHRVGEENPSAEIKAEDGDFKDLLKQLKIELTDLLVKPSN